MIVHPSELLGEISIPASKSISHRALILTAFSEIGSLVTNLLESEDTLSTLDSLKRMGAEFIKIKNGYQLKQKAHHGAELACNNSGTTLRLLTGVLSLFEEESSLMGDDSLNSRPMGPLIDALGMLGVDIRSTDRHAPIFVMGGVRNNHCEIKGDTSSQFVSSLMMLAAIRKGSQTVLDIIKPIVSRPYMELTEKMLINVGIKLKKEENDINLRYIIDGGEFGKNAIRVPPDYSSAAFFVAAATLKNNKIKIKGMSDELPQADSKILTIIEEMGAIITRDKNGFEIVSSKLKPIDINIADSPDIFPILAVLAAMVPGDIRISGAHHLRYKETDRIKTTTQILRKMGVLIEPTDDGAVISSHTIKGGAEVDSHGDHRIAMAASIAATLADNPVRINNAACVDVSYPSFFADLKKLGGKIDIIEIV